MDANDHEDSDGRYSGKQHLLMPEILPTLAWILCDYSDLLPAALKSAHLPPLNADSTATSSTGTHKMNCRGPYHAIAQVYLHAVVKVVAAASPVKSSIRRLQEKELEACLAALELNLPIFVQSVDVEDMERAFTAL
ncbi:hypothetical protein ACA910_008095 [Epithemia clementina (nom. ined.)]